MSVPELSRGDVVLVDLEPTRGSETRKVRPCVVVQNDVGNKYSPATIVVPITGAEHVKKLYPVNVGVPEGEGGLTKDSVALCNQVRTVDKARILEKRGRFSAVTMAKIDDGLRVALSLVK